MTLDFGRDSAQYPQEVRTQSSTTEHSARVERKASVPNNIVFGQVSSQQNDTLKKYERGEGDRTWTRRVSDQARSEDTQKTRSRESSNHRCGL